MDIASLVLGIIGLISSFFTIFCGGCVSIITGPIGLVLGIVDLINKNKKGLPKGMAIAGIILNAIAILITIVIFLFLIVIGNSYYYY